MTWWQMWSMKGCLTGAHTTLRYAWCLLPSLVVLKAVARCLPASPPACLVACLLMCSQADHAVDCQVHRAGEDTWYQVQDLHVTDILPQMVALSETYLQVR